MKDRGWTQYNSSGAIKYASVGMPGPMGPPGLDGLDFGEQMWMPPGIIGGNQITITTTGNIDDLDFGNANLIHMNNASLTTIRGLKAGYSGQKVVISSRGAGQVDLAYKNTGSAVANRLENFATSAATSLAAGTGHVIYQYDTVDALWHMISHFQGAWIDVAYASGDFTGSGTITWTVAAGDVSAHRYYLDGRTLYMVVALDTTSVSGAGNQLFIAVPGGFTVAGTCYGVLGDVIDNGVATTGFYRANTVGDVIIGCIRTDAANWAASVDNTYIRGMLIFDVQ